MKNNLLDILNGEEVQFLDGLAERFRVEYEPHNSIHAYAKFSILKTWEGFLSWETLFSKYKGGYNGGYGSISLSDSNSLYLLGTLYRCIEFGTKENESYRLKPEECPEFLRVFEKIYNSINKDKLITDPITRQQHNGIFVGSFETLDKAKEWLEWSKKELIRSGHKIKVNK